MGERCRGVPRRSRSASLHAQAQSCTRAATKHPDGQITADFPKLESSQGIKNIPLHMSGKSPLQARPVSPDERGGSRSSRTRGGMRWTSGLRTTSAGGADGEAVWSWRPDAGVKLARSVPPAMVARKPGHQGERGVSRKPPRREGRIASAEPVCSCAFFCAFCTRDRGCSAHPAFPAPSS